MFNRFCLLAVLSLSCFSVQAAKPIAVPTPVAQDLPVELIESQQEIAVTVPQTASAVGMQFGLIGAIVGSAIQNSQAKKAEEAVVPVRNLLVDYPFNQRMRDALEPKLASPGLSPHPSLTVLPTTWEARDAQQSAKLPPYALVLTPSYSIDNDFARMTVNLRAQVVDRTVKSNGKIKAVPRVSHTYSFHFPMQGERSDDPVQDWVAMGAAGLGQLLEQGIAQTTDMLVQDFSEEGRSWWNQKADGAGAIVDGNVYDGLEVRQGEGWAWVRNGKGMMQTVQGYQPLTVGVMPALPVAAAHVAEVAQAPVAMQASTAVVATDTPTTAAAVATTTGTALVAGEAAPTPAGDTPAAAPAAAPAEPPPQAPAAPAAETAPAVPVGG